MGSAFLKAPEGVKSLHERTLELPFYRRLFNSKDITPNELLQHFVNNSAIFKKMETIVKTEKTFQEIIGENLYRHSAVEKDIAFFMDKFNLERHPICHETECYLNYMDETSKTDPRLFIAILYTQYGGLFIGRAVRASTMEILENRLSDWNQLPQDNRGVSYWDFEGQTTSDEREKAKNRMMDAINDRHLTRDYPRNSGRLLSILLNTILIEFNLNRP